MLALKTPKGWSVPIQDFHDVQQKNLRSIKNRGEQIAEMDKLSAYYPEIRFKNVARFNNDGSVDVIIDAGVANEIQTGFLPKRYYKAIRVKQEKGLLGSKWNYLDTIQVAEKDIISQFGQSLSIEDIETILGAITKKGVNYFG
ncbi:hypothetical protein [Enterococcus gallinarum]|uniref:hypothetical protein n=1 Tax=Enterococcus gallinarum TaxID=1353 RepID=UPI0028917150|nr:hypothetical protein [Enterococcus gallinarum]MDT2685815.1 hypothetical protein [Enterococcus gallinarum]